MEFLSFEMSYLDWIESQLGKVCMLYVMEGNRPDTVSLLKQEIANCGLIIQQIKVNLNKLSSPKTKEQLNQYNYCVEQLDKAKKN